MTLDPSTRRLVAQLLHAVQPLAAGFVPKTDEHGRIALTVTEGDHATARAAVDAARAALGYPRPEDAPVSRATARRQAGVSGPVSHT